MPHEVKIPDYVIERIMAKRGKLSVFDSFEATKTAFLVIDMQNFYVAEVDTAISIVPNINRIAAVLKDERANEPKSRPNPNIQTITLHTTGAPIMAPQKSGSLTNLSSSTRSQSTVQQRLSSANKPKSGEQQQDR